MLGRYRIEAELPPGPAGRFYRALDTGRQATVAVNVLDASLRTREGHWRFLTAARDAAQAGDQRLLDLGIWEDVYYVAVTYDAERPLLDLGAFIAGSAKQGHRWRRWLINLRHGWSRRTTR